MQLHLKVGVVRLIEFEVRIQGHRKFRRTAEGLPSAMRAAIINALPRIGLLIEATGRDMAPVKTGRLRSSFGHFDSSFMVDVNPEASPEDAHWVLGRNFVEVGTKVPYARRVTDDNPFLTSTVRMVHDEIISMAEDAAREGLLQAFGKRVSKRTRSIVRRMRGRRGL